MMRAIQRLSAIMLLWGLGGACVFGQGILSSPEEIAADTEECMLTFLESWQPNQQRVAWITRGELWGFIGNSENTMDWICGSLQDSAHDFRYEFASRTVSVSYGENIRLWEQLISSNSTSVHRIGTGGTNDRVLFDSGAKEKATTQDPRNGKQIGRIGYGDPHAMAVGPLSNLFSNSLQEDWPVKVFLENGRFVGAKLSKRGGYVGLWQCFGAQGSVVLVEFDSKVDPKPIRVEWRRASGEATLESFADLRLFCIVRTKWASFQVDGVERKLPVEVAMGQFDAEGFQFKELTAFTRWEFEEDVKVPKWNSELIRNTRDYVIDWRDPILFTFQENWNLMFRQVKDNQPNEQSDRD